MTTRFVLGVLALACAAATPLVAQEKPIQLSLFTPVQIVPENEGVGVLRLKQGGAMPVLPIVNWSF